MGRPRVLSLLLVDQTGMANTDIRQRIDTMVTAWRRATTAKQAALAEAEYAIGGRRVPQWVRRLRVGQISDWLRTLPAPPEEMALFDMGSRFPEPVSENPANRDYERRRKQRERAGR